MHHETRNCARYTHFHTGQRGNYNSPFDRGLKQNFIDFFEYRCLGFLRPIKDDWYNRYDTTEDLQKRQNNKSEDREPLLQV